MKNYINKTTGQIIFVVESFEDYMAISMVNNARTKNKQTYESIAKDVRILMEHEENDFINTNKELRCAYINHYGTFIGAMVSNKELTEQWEALSDFLPKARQI